MEPRNLDLIAGGVGVGSLEERRRLPRVLLSTVQFRLSDNGKIFSVVDLSIEGLSLRMPESEDLVVYPIGRAIHGVLNLDGQKLKVEWKVTYLRKDESGARVGGAFEPLDSGVRKALEEFLSPENQGRELKPFPADSGMIWFHSGRGCEVFFREAPQSTPDNPQFLELYFGLMGQYLRWTRDGNLESGTTQPAEQQGEVRGVILLETLRFLPDASLDLKKLSVAKTIILSSNLPEPIQKWTLERLAQ